jgi:tetratricopeptide (TPR) repeat protein
MAAPDDRSRGRADGRGRRGDAGRGRTDARGGRDAGRGRSDARGGRDAGRGRSDAGRGGRPPAGRDPQGGRVPRTADQAEYDGPDLPEEITGKELDRSVLDQLSGLPEKLAARVARHLAAAGALVDDDPETAYRHALAARARAARVAVVREAVGETAYTAGHYAEALAELKAARRMNAAVDYLPVMADCERALGRPERALALAASPPVAKLPQHLRVEMTIVEAGARLDLGEVDGALRTLERAPLRSISREDWVVRLRYAYASTLAAAGRSDEALEWFHRTVAIDGNEITDAPDRIAELEAAGAGADS